MDRKIKNWEQLLDHGVTASRTLVLELTEQVLERLDSYKRIKELISLKGNLLKIGTRTWDLERKRNVYLIGAGKACNAMAKAVEDVLGDRRTGGIIIVNCREEHVFSRVRVFEGGHPIPNRQGYEACLEILKLVDQATADDLFILVMSGGSSALMSCPVEEITLEEEMQATDVLLKSGADIYRINAVRRHISQMNGGRLAERIGKRGAELIGIGISDAVGKPATTDMSIPWKDYVGTPMGPDQTTFKDARDMIEEFCLKDRLPYSVVEYIMNGTEERETPKNFPGNTYFVLNTVPDSCTCAMEIARKMGINAVILSTFMEGESCEAGTFMACLAREIQENRRPFRAPLFVISCGETTTRIEDDRKIKGHGGPSHEMAAGFALAASRIPGSCLLSIDTEGTDGTTMAAGGMTDSQTLCRAARAGVDLRDALRGHSSHEALAALGDAVVTGNTGTNLCDFNVLYVPMRTSGIVENGGGYL